MISVVKMKFGSHLYGTNTPESDLDFKAVHLPSASDILLQRVNNSIKVAARKKAEGEKNVAGDVDADSYSLQYFLQLLAEGQTVAIDMLFAPTEALIETSLLWEVIQANRDKLISRKSAAFIGYCRQQASKYGIKGSRVAAAKAAMEFFDELIELGLLSSKLFEFQQSLEVLVSMSSDHMSIVEQAINSAGDTGRFFECCNRKVGFNNTIKEAHAIFSRIYENYGDRARKAQDSNGVDWKALSHAVRVGYEALELLKTGKVTLPLQDAGHVLEIKQGKLSYPEVADEIERLLVDVETAAQSSALPESADQLWIDDFVEKKYRKLILDDCGY